MTVEDVSSLTPSTPSSDDTIAAPAVNVYVTTNVKVIPCGAILPSDGDENPRLTIITSAVLKVPSTTDEDSDLSKDSSGESCTVTYDSSNDFEDIFDQPVLRRSKKGTQLNINLELKKITNKKTDIERIAILPYLGCAAKKESLILCGQNMLLSSSKSWRTTGLLEKTEKPCQSCQSQLQTKLPSVKHITNTDNQRFLPKKSMYSIDNQLPEYSFMSLWDPLMRSVYYIRGTDSSSKILIDDDSYMNYERKPAYCTHESPDLKKNFPKKTALEKNTLLFEKELTPNLYIKTTRNASIQYRPRTRDKATSTTSLNKISNVEESPNNSIKKLLMPFIGVEKDFPSLLVLKLIPKKEAVECKREKHSDGGDMKSINSSDSNLLTPKLDISDKSKKKKTEKCFINPFCIFKKKKKTDNLDSDSNESFSKEVYYPSIVEVYNKKRRSSVLQEGESDITSGSICSSFYREKKKKYRRS